MLPGVLASNGIRQAVPDGRVLAETFEGGPDAEKVPVETRTYIARGPAAGYRAALRVGDVARFGCIDARRRLRP